MSEIWKDIKGYENLYQISNLGNVRSLSFGAKNIQRSNKIKLLKPSRNNCGYYKVQLYNKGTSKMFYVHRLVADAFIPKIEGKDQVNHIDGNKANNIMDNLEWCSASDNQKHAIINGLRASSPMLGKTGLLNHKSKPILQYKTDGTFVKRWDSITEASIFLRCNTSIIWRCLSGKRKTAKGYLWKYE